MKKIFFIIIAVIAIILFFNMYGTFAYQSNQSKPYIDFKKKIDISQLFDYRDPTYGYTISYPDFFEHEDTSLSNYQSYARFSYTDRTNVVLESLCNEESLHIITDMCRLVGDKASCHKNYEQGLIISACRSGIRKRSTHEGLQSLRQIHQEWQTPLRLLAHLSRRLQTCHVQTVPSDRKLENRRGILMFFGNKMSYTQKNFVHLQLIKTNLPFIKTIWQRKQSLWVPHRASEWKWQNCLPPKDGKWE